MQQDINNCTSSLHCHNIDISNWDEKNNNNEENKTGISKWKDIDKFLTNRFQALETVFGPKHNKSDRTPMPQTTLHLVEADLKRLGTTKSVSRIGAQVL